MAVQRWNPWHDLMRMQEDFNRTIESFMRPGSVSEFRWMPDVDVYETDGEIKVHADIPDVEAKDVDVSITDNTLRIKGERKYSKEVKKENYLMSERRYGSFERMIDLPEPVKPEEVQAVYKDGVLEITLPKAEEKKAKEIKVKVA
jgi:HSP20 family protein